MTKVHKQPRGAFVLLALIVVLATLGVILFLLAHEHNVALFNPKGMVADEQHRLMILSTLIMFVLAIPVIATIYFFIWKYREIPGQAAHAPTVKNNKAFLLFSWGAPLTIVIILAVLMLPATHRLQPQKPIDAKKDQMTVKVVALRWKWLFIYPEQNVASVNFVQLPVDTPVRFEITADEMPMSSFWIPNLGGMLYSMTGHVNPLNLIADTPGDYPGSTAEVNGPGFAGMRFTARVSTQKEFDAWVAKNQQLSTHLDTAEYEKLLQPSENNKAAFYSHPDPHLFMMILGKYQHNMDGMHMEGME